jgi:hypothetical protein
MYVCKAAYCFSQDPHSPVYIVCVCVKHAGLRKTVTGKDTCHSYNSTVGIFMTVQPHCSIHHEVSVSGNFLFASVPFMQRYKSC